MRYLLISKSRRHAYVANVNSISVGLYPINTPLFIIYYPEEDCALISAYDMGLTVCGDPVNQLLDEMERIFREYDVVDSIED